MKRSLQMVLAVAASLAAAAPVTPLAAQIAVSSAATLQADITAGDTNFILTGNITGLTTPIFIGTTSYPTITINGAGYSMTGTSEIFFVQSGNVTLSDITLSGNAVGGNGASSQTAAGGALGAGGAIFIGSMASVTASDVLFVNDSATGGSGGADVGSGAGGGGGMNGGNGGLGPLTGGGGGGGNAGNGGVGSNAGGGGGGLLANGGNAGGGVGGNGGGTNGGVGGNTGSGQNGGANSGGGGSGTFASSGNGGNGGTNGGGGGAPFGHAGNGGAYGGGGGSIFYGGNGGFGGGGGAGGAFTGGNGGFGGGGGASQGSAGTGGVGAGNGGHASAAAGGGGAGLGGAVFEQTGGEFIETGSGTYTGSSVTGGTGANAGAAAGSSLFIMTGAGIIIAPGSGNTILVNGTIADDSASSLPGGTYTSGTATGVGIQFGFATSVGGTVILNGTNTFSGGGTITNFATVELWNPHGLGTGPITNSIGVLTVGNGNHSIVLNGYTQSSLGNLSLYVNGAGGGATADLLHITNTLSSQATLGGGLAINFSGFTAAPTIAPAHTLDFTVVETNAGYTGTFTSFAPLGLNGATASLDYTGDDVNVQIVVPASAISTLGLTPNESGIATSINSAILSGNVTPSLATVATALASLPVTSVAGALDELSPAKVAAFYGSTAVNDASIDVQEMDSYFAGRRIGPDGTFVGGNGQLDSSGFVVNDPNVDPGLQMIHSRMLAWNDLPSTISDIPGAALGGIDMKQVTPASTGNDKPWNFFLRGSVILGQGFSQQDIPHYDDSTASVLVGADYRVTPHVLVGATAGYAHTDATLDPAGSTATVDSYSPGIYASYADDGWYANFLGRYSYNSYTSQRAMPFLGQSASGATDGHEGTASLDGGYNFRSGGWTYGPIGGLQYTHLTVNSYNESGSDADLAVGEDQTDSLRSRLGGTVRFDWRHAGMTFSPHLEATWQHEYFDQGRGLTSQFTAFNGGSFTVRTDSPSRDSALVDAGLDAKINDTFTVFADYLVEAGQSDYFGQSVQAGVRIHF